MEKTSRGNKRKYSVPAVDIAFKILTLLSRKNYRKSKLSEIAKALSLNPTTCFRILYQLDELSIVSYDQVTKEYTLGPYLLVLGERAKEHLHDISLIKPYMERLTAETNLTATLYTRVGENRVTIIAKEEADFGVNASIGRHFSLADGAYGKCIMAHLNEEDWDYYIGLNEESKKSSKREIERIKDEFKEIKEIGYAISYGETIKGIFGVAAPILSYTNKVDMSISLVGLTAQYEKEDLIEIGLVIKEVAAEITNKIKNV
jgi:DNA-binding IclR family transcriptional regulator